MGIRDFVTNATNLREINRAIRSALGRRNRGTFVGRLLLIEEERWARERIARALELAGYDVIQTGRGSQALALLREQPVDLVIADVATREGDGVELVEELRSRYAELHVVAIASTAAAAEDLDAARAVGASGVLDEPFDYRRLVTLVRGLLGR